MAGTLELSGSPLRLLKLKEQMQALTYRNGTGRVVEGALDIYANTLLVTLGIRNAFMVQWVDYLDPKVYYYIMQALRECSRWAEDLGDRLLFHTINEGVLITTYRDYYEGGLRGEIKAYEEAWAKRSSETSILLGHILSYPAAGELEGERKKTERFNISIYVRSKNRVFQGYHQVLANIYRTPEARKRFYRFYEVIVNIVGSYDPDLAWWLEDGQDPETELPELDRVYLKITPEERRIYSAFIRDPARLREIWNTAFDLEFEESYGRYRGGSLV